MSNSKLFNHPILITGGAGYLGSHMTAFCLENNINVVLLDNLSNSDLTNLKKLELFFNSKLTFFKIDITNYKDLKFFFKEHQFSAVIHFAGLKSVSESLEYPKLYMKNNVQGTSNLIDCIKDAGIKKVIFSSSATVYGDPKYLPIDEQHPIQPMNPYGESKAKVEQLFLQDPYFRTASVKLLRYFNPVGSFKGIIGEKPKGIPNNLMPYIIGVAKGEFEYLNIFGDDYKTTDGTGVRDYIHVIDLIEAHWAALLNNNNGCHIYNIGCGEGFSVKEMIKVFEKINQMNIPIKIKPRRPGDIARCFANVDKANRDLLWKAKYSIQDMCLSAWQGSNL